MTYAALLDNEGINSQYLVVLKPRRLIDTSYTLVSGNIYKTSFELGNIISATNNGVDLTDGGDVTPSSGQFYYDVEAMEFYINVGTDPAARDIVVTYEIFIGTFDAHWYRDPTDDTSLQVYYEPLVTRSPLVKSSTSDILFGFLPSITAQISISNATQFIQEHVYASSFKQAEIDIYHWLGDLETANVKKILAGICGNIAYSDDSTELSIFDRLSFLDNEYRNDTGDNFYYFSNFGSLDPSAEGRPIRQVYGLVEGFMATNIDYQNVEPTTSDNRIWVFIAGHSNVGNFSTTVLASPASTATRTYLTDATGFNGGDQIANSTASQYAGIYSVQKTSAPHYIDHGSWVTASTGNTITRGFASNVQIIQDGRNFQLVYLRDYTIYTDATRSVSGIQLSTSCEANQSMSRTINPSDTVSSRVYGHTNTVTLGGNPFGSNSADVGVLSQGIVILFDLLKRAGISESDISTATFTSLQASIVDQIGLAIPWLNSETFPTFKQLIIDISRTLLLKIYLDDNNQWSASQIGPVGSSNKSIEDDEIIRGSFRTNYSYDELASQVTVQYLRRQMSVIFQLGDFKTQVQTTNNLATRLHLAKKEKVIQSLHFLDSEADALSQRLAFIFGDRLATTVFRTKNRFFDTQLNDIINVSRTRLGGFAFDTETNRSRDHAVDSTSKSLTEIEITLNDQKGIEDNSGSW